MPARAVIFGCGGHALTPSEAALFREADPWGFILFARNVETPEQVLALCASLRDCVGREAPILIDQEGGRVQRMGAPHWRIAPPAGAFGALYERDRGAAVRAVRLNHRLIAHDLKRCGVDVCCAPVLDLPVDGADPIIGDRAFSKDSAAVATLGRAALIGLHEGGVAGVVKHIPGHGRGDVDSHEKLPRVSATRNTLEAKDYVPFYAMADAAMAMTAHIVYTAYDDAAPATLSRMVIRDVIRDYIGFSGLLMTDDLSMKALEGPMGTRVSQAIAAGCDVVLHCNGDADEMTAIAAEAPVLADLALQRAEAAELARGVETPLDFAEAEVRLTELLSGDTV